MDGFKDRAHIAKKGDTRAFIAPEGNHRELYQIPNSERQYFDVTFAPTVPVALRTVLTKHSAKGYLPPA